MKQFDEDEKNILLRESKKKNLVLELVHHYKLFDGDIDRVIYILRK